MQLSFSAPTEKWRGQYFYGDSYSAAYRGRAVEFSVEWKVDDDTLQGTCTDEETQDFFAAPATVSGFRADNFISFVKRYPSAWHWDAAGKVHVNPKLPSAEIHYSGLLTNGCLEGEWLVTTDLRATNTLVEQRVFQGTWFLHRIA